MTPPASLVTVSAIVAVPVLPASALVMAGTSLAGESGTVKVEVVVPPDRAAALLANPSRHYFNVHTALNPDGAMRGQFAGDGTVIPY